MPPRVPAECAHAKDDILPPSQAASAHQRSAGQDHGTSSISAPRRSAQVAQLVEQRTENPCVGGSIPPLGTTAVVPQAPGTTTAYAFVKNWRDRGLPSIRCGRSP